MTGDSGQGEWRIIEKRKPQKKKISKVKNLGVIKRETGKIVPLCQNSRAGGKIGKIDRMRDIRTETESMWQSAGLRMSVEQRDVLAQCTAEYCNTCNY